MRVWRIASAAHDTLDGEGARRYGSRWTREDFAAIFASATLSLAALERFVNTDPDLEPADLVAISVDIATSVAIESVNLADLPADWRTYPAPLALATIGERWLRESRSSVFFGTVGHHSDRIELHTQSCARGLPQARHQPIRAIQFQSQDVEDEKWSLAWARCMRRVIRASTVKSP